MEQKFFFSPITPHLFKTPFKRGANRMFADLILRCFRRKAKTRKLKNVQDVHSLAPPLKNLP